MGLTRRSEGLLRAGVTKTAPLCIPHAALQAPSTTRMLPPASLKPPLQRPEPQWPRCLNAYWDGSRWELRGGKTTKKKKRRRSQKAPYSGQEIAFRCWFTSVLFLALCIQRLSHALSVPLLQGIRRRSPRQSQTRGSLPRSDANKEEASHESHPVTVIVADTIIPAASTTAHNRTRPRRRRRPRGGSASCSRATPATATNSDTDNHRTTSISTLASTWAVPLRPLLSLPQKRLQTAAATTKMEPQQQQQQPNKQTPARRRAKRPVNSPARKTYASENDMPSEAVFPIDLAGPFTPQKSASNSPLPQTQTQQSKSKPRNGNKARAKQASSPGPVKHGRTTPPQTTAPKPIAAHAPAFAGATFHASPAPSSLPIPSFLSKALDSPVVHETDRASREPSPPATDSEAPTPQQRFVPREIARQESPLDIFFRADRAEKERARRASSANILGPGTIPFSPPAQTPSPAEPKTLPGGGLFGAGNRRPGFQRNPSSGIPASELDGIPGDSVGPAFSKSYHDRIRAARSGNNNKPSEPVQTTPSGSLPQDTAATSTSTDDMSERLKRFLAIAPTQNGQPQGPTPTQPAPSTATPPRFAEPSPAFLSGSRPPATANLPRPFVLGARTDAVPAGAGAGAGPFAGVGAGVHPLLAPPAMRKPEPSRPPEIVHMEDSLRRMLKMNLGGATGPQAN